jgi:hypothetical protein
MFAAAAWKLLQGETPSALEAITGDLPSVNPYVTITANWIEYLAGGNPRDDFRGRDIIPRDEYLVGGWPAFRSMLQWTSDQTGVGGQLIRMTGAFDRETEPRSFFEKLVRIPAPVLPLIKISDRGVREQEQEAIEGEERIDAETRLAFGERVRTANRKLSRLEALSRTDKGLTAEQEAELQSLKAFNRLYRKLRPEMEQAVRDKDVEKQTEIRQELLRYLEQLQAAMAQ